MLQGGTEYADLKDNVCIFDKHRMCNQCFNCIGIINRKKPEQLSLLETARLMQYKLFNFNLANFENKLNEKFKNNGGIGERIHYQITFDAENSCMLIQLFTMKCVTLMGMSMTFLMD